MKKQFRLYPIVVLLSLLFSLFLLVGCSMLKEGDTEYNVTNEYFTFLSFKPSTSTSVDLKTNNRTYKYHISITSSCAVSLYEYRAEVTLYSSNGVAIHSDTVSSSQTIAADTEFTFYVDVDQQKQASTTSVQVVYSGKSHDNPQPAESKYCVTFVYNNNTANKVVTVNKGATVQTPNDPTKANYIFTGWYTDKTFYNKYDFSKAVTQSFTLYAAYELDATTITNEISRNTIRGIVKIYNKSYNSFLGIETSSSTAQGSGFCFHIQNGYYYVLTNCHVAKKNDSYSNQKITIEDYQGNSYTGYIYKNSNKSYEAIAASYDLACLYFKPTSTNVKALSISSDPSISDDVVSLGAPKGQSNFITFGSVNTYKKVTLSNTSTSQSNVQFEVIEHTAWIDGGSSGGPLLNANLQVVGVNYAGSDKTQTSVNRSYAIPASSVNEFLRSYVYN